MSMFCRHLLIITGLLCFLSNGTLSAQSHCDDIIGVWLNEKREAVVNIYKQNNVYYGEIIDIRGEHAAVKHSLKDLKNPVPEHRSRPLIGMTLIENLVFHNGTYGGGTAYNPRMGRYFDCKAWLVTNNQMKIRGYWGLIYATETWERLRN